MTMGCNRSKFHQIKSTPMNRKEPEKKSRDIPLFLRKRVRFERFSNTQVYCAECSPCKMDLHCPHSSHNTEPEDSSEKSRTQEGQQGDAPGKGVYFLHGDFVVQEHEEYAVVQPNYPFATVKARKKPCSCTRPSNPSVKLLSFKQNEENE